jgi:hypothetical protein
MPKDQPIWQEAHPQGGNKLLKIEKGDLPAIIGANETAVRDIADKYCEEGHSSKVKVKLL